MKQVIAETDTNFVSMVFMKEAEGVNYPTEQQLAQIVKQVRGEKLEAYVDNVKQGTDGNAASGRKHQEG